jgi:hypothetical protein
VRVRRRRRGAARLPTCHELVCAPELAILTSIEMALDVALVALVAAQPELHPTADGYDAASTPAAVAADHIIVCAQTLAVAIADYRAALRDPSHNDLPF